MHTWIHTGEKSCCDSSALFVFNGSEMMDKICMSFSILMQFCKERSGSVLECLTQDRGTAGSSLTLTVLWSLSKTHLS